MGCVFVPEPRVHFVRFLFRVIHLAPLKSLSSQFPRRGTCRIKKECCRTRFCLLQGCTWLRQCEHTPLPCTTLVALWHCPTFPEAEEGLREKIVGRHVPRVTVTGAFFDTHELRT